MDKSYTKIFLKDVTALVRIGILPFEYEKPQRIVVNVELFAEKTDYLQTASCETIIDYGTVYDLIQSWETRAHTDLIETFVKELQAACFDYKDVTACRVSVLKTEIFDRAAGAGVEAFITRDQFSSLRGT